MEEVRVDGDTRAWVLARDLPQLEEPPEANGVRFLAAGDPLLLGRDRERLVPDAGARKRLWTMIGGAGLVLADGEPVALWRGRKQGRRLTVAVEPLGRGPARGDGAGGRAPGAAPRRPTVTVDWP